MPHRKHGNIYGVPISDFTTFIVNRKYEFENMNLGQVHDGIFKFFQHRLNAETSIFYRPTIQLIVMI